MMEQWKQILCNTGVFIICAQMLMHLRPAAAYEKYFKMLVGAMILICLMSPILSIADGEEAEEWFGIMEGLEDILGHSDDPGALGERYSGLWQTFEAGACAGTESGEENTVTTYADAIEVRTGVQIQISPIDDFHITVGGETMQPR